MKRIAISPEELLSLQRFFLLSLKTAKRVKKTAELILICTLRTPYPVCEPDNNAVGNIDNQGEMHARHRRDILGRSAQEFWWSLKWTGISTDWLEGFCLRSVRGDF